MVVKGVRWSASPAANGADIPRRVAPGGPASYRLPATLPGPTDRSAPAYWNRCARLQSGRHPSPNSGNRRERPRFAFAGTRAQAFTIEGIATVLALQQPLQQIQGAPARLARMAFVFLGSCASMAANTSGSTRACTGIGSQSSGGTSLTETARRGCTGRLRWARAAGAAVAPDVSCQTPRCLDKPDSSRCPRRHSDPTRSCPGGSAHPPGSAADRPRQSSGDPGSPRQRPGGRHGLRPG